MKRNYNIFLGVLVVLLSLAMSVFSANTSKPEIFYSSPKSYTIADIKVSGIENYEDYVLIGISGLSVGQQVRVPGDDITDAIKRFWRQGLFSDVKIVANKIEDGKVWLEIQLKPRPRIDKIIYDGVKKSEKDDIKEKIGLVVGNQITPNIIDRSKYLITQYFDEKGYKNADINIQQKVSKKDGFVDVYIDVKKKDKIKVNRLIIDGNYALSDGKINAVMKKTNEKGRFVNIFKTKKFIESNYFKDKLSLIQKYNEYGYRDAAILKDSVYPFDDKTVNVYIKVKEGQKFYHRNISWVGNTVYNADQLNAVLKIQKGDVYNQKRLDERLENSKNEDAVSNLYLDNGYLFFHVEPVEVKIEGDSIDLEMRLYEGKPATIRRINISGNDRLYENVIRRELRVKPGALFSKSDLVRSAREIAQTGHFDPENMGINPIPDQETSTVDIDLNLTSKSNDQVEFSAGYGSTGVVGSISLKFTNFSIRNLLNFNTYRVVPQGDGETLTLTGTTNGSYYNSYSFSYVQPWWGGKRPNSLHVSAFYSRQSSVSSRYYNNSNIYNAYNSYGSYGGYGYGSSYGNSYYDSESYQNSYMYEIDPDTYLKMWGASLGIGARLSWPDDYFQLYSEISYKRYSLKNWSGYFFMSDGVSNDLDFSFTLSRKSIDNPLYTRTGSDFSLKVSTTFPYSFFENKNNEDYESMELSELYKWIEYYKIEFKSKSFTPLTKDNKLVLMTRFDLGYLGYYNKNKLSPYGQYYVGGDGMSGYSSSYTYQTIGLRGYENGALGVAPIYEKATMELRYPLVLETQTTIYALAFAEAGNVWLNAGSWNPLSLKRSAGVGVRIFLPMVGMLGIDWAYGFDPASGVSGYNDVSGSQIHFIIGQEF